MPIGETGPLYDREWGVFGVENRAERTQRDKKFERLALVQPIPDEGGFRLEAQGCPTTTHLSFLRQHTARETWVTIWGDLCHATVEEEASAWFSSFLGEDVLVARKGGPRFINRMTTEGERQVSFADRYQALGISMATFHKILDLLKERTDINRFRPNLIFDECPPQDENHWQEIRIGTLAAYGVKPCNRCSVVNVEQETGRRTQELLKILGKHFTGSMGSQIVGENFVFEGSTSTSPRYLEIGSPVNVVQRRPEGWDRPYDDRIREGKLGIAWRLLQAQGIGRALRWLLGKPA